jgi:hypothetical protein
MARVSLPAPPLKLSPGFSVVPLATKPLVPITALNVSLPVTLVVPAEPTSEELSALVVSDLFCTQNGVNTHLFCLYFDIRPDIDSITTNDHQ